MNFFMGFIDFGFLKQVFIKLMLKGGLLKEVFYINKIWEITCVPKFFKLIKANSDSYFVIAD